MNARQSAGLSEREKAARREPRRSSTRQQVLLQGRLSVRRKKGVEPRTYYFVLTPSTLEYFEDVEAYSGHQDAKGTVALHEIGRVELVEGGLRIVLEDDGQALPLCEVAAGDAERWAQAIICAQEAARPRDGEVDDPVLFQGAVLLLKRDAAEPRHLVLWEDRFAYFASEEDFHTQQTPRAQVPLDALAGVKVKDDTITVTLATRSREMSFRTAGGKKEAQSWGKAFDAARSQQQAWMADVEPAEPEQAGPREPDASCLHEGELALTQDGKKAVYHCVLFQDQLQYFSSLASLQSGRPDGCLLLEDVEDLDVEDTHLVMTSRDGREVVLEETIEGELQGWVDAFGQVLETDEPHQQQQQQQTSGSRSRSCGNFKTTTNLQDGPSRCVHEGQLLLAVRPGQLEPRYVVLYGDSIDIFGSQADSDGGRPPLCSVDTADVCRVSIQDDGFVIGLEDEELELRLPQDTDFEAWIGALRGVMDPSEQAVAETEPVFSPLSLSSASTAATATAFNSKSHIAGELPLVREMAEPRVAAWLKSLHQDPPYFHGVLWLQSGHGQVPRFCVLFGNRIDSWDSPMRAAARQQPEGRIMLGDVRSLTPIGGGFVMALRGRKMGIYVGDPAYRQGWTKALDMLLNPVPDGMADLGSQMIQQLPPGPAPKASSSWIPRVATLQPQRSARSCRSDATCRSSPRRHNTEATRSSITARAAVARRQVCQSNPEDKAGVSSAKAYSEAAAKLSESLQDRVYSPRSPLNSNAFVSRPENTRPLAGKVNPPAQKAKDKSSGAVAVAEKVSGPGGTSPRDSNRGVAPKITSSIPSRGGGATQGVADKITYAPRARSPRAALTGKITAGH